MYQSFTCTTYYDSHPTVRQNSTSKSKFKSISKSKSKPLVVSMIYYTFQFIQMDLRKTVTIVAVMVAIAVIGNVPETEARPSYSDGWAVYNRQYPNEQRRTVTECDPAVRELCQRCAKVTKSRVAYPLCCAEELPGENVTRNWCEKFLNFGRPSKSNPA